MDNSSGSGHISVLLSQPGLVPYRRDFTVCVDLGGRVLEMCFYFILLDSFPDTFLDAHIYLPVIFPYIYFLIPFPEKIPPLFITEHLFHLSPRYRTHKLWL